MQDVTFIILTKNEEINLPDCLESIKDFAKRIVVVDSESTDATVEIVSKGMNKVKFIVPYGVDKITITTKNAEKINVVNTYRVVI